MKIEHKRGHAIFLFLIFFISNIVLLACKKDLNSYPVGYMLSIEVPNALDDFDYNEVKLDIEILDNLDIGVLQSDNIIGQFSPYYDTKDNSNYSEEIPSFRRGLKRRFKISIYKKDKLIFQDVLTVKTKEDYLTQDNLVVTEILKFDNMDNVESVDRKNRTILLKDLHY